MTIPRSVCLACKADSSWRALASSYLALLARPSAAPSQQRAQHDCRRRTIQCQKLSCSVRFQYLGVDITLGIDAVGPALGVDPLELLPRDVGAAAHDARKSRIADGDAMDDAALPAEFEI
jgi:hypothetical protein